MNQTPVTLHAISMADLEAVAALHSASWRSAYLGAGIGRGLLTAVAHVADERATHPGLFLWCYEQNTRARAFYEHLGAEAVERIMYAAPDGQSHPEWRYAWRTMPVAP